MDQQCKAVRVTYTVSSFTANELQSEFHLRRQVSGSSQRTVIGQPVQPVDQSIFIWHDLLRPSGGLLKSSLGYPFILIQSIYYSVRFQYGHCCLIQQITDISFLFLYRKATNSILLYAKLIYMFSDLTGCYALLLDFHVQLNACACVQAMPLVGAYCISSKLDRRRKKMTKASFTCKRIITRQTNAMTQQMRKAIITC
ncbi:hypothetical protein Tsp_07782 [Trichinella spiralis]|uniref:hypothetical protein n=1 Tax=Trichinella spiralis TaxID=6334 RepID=UPI0001EFCC1B|nr:hypothetical protein Tsp_07782 [Trichinella spiralis]